MANKRSVEPTDRMRRFADAYLTSLDPIESARSAGYSGTDATLSVTACKLLKDDRIQAYLAEKRAILDQKNDDMLNRLVTHLGAIGFANMRDFAKWDAETVGFTPSKDLTELQAYAIKKIKGEKRPILDGEGQVIDESLRLEIELCSKEAALKLLAQYYGLDNDFNGAIACLQRYGLFVKRDVEQPSGWRVDREA